MSPMSHQAAPFLRHSRSWWQSDKLVAGKFATVQRQKAKPIFQFVFVCIFVAIPKTVEAPLGGVLVLQT